METVTLRQLNRWTLARQMLLERAELDAVSAVERLAGMQAQYSPSPYVGLWSRLRSFRREELESALTQDHVFKATLMRGTLHLVSARDFDSYRIVTRHLNHIYSQMVRQLRELGVDVEAIRDEIISAVRERPLSRQEIRTVGKRHVPDQLPDWAAWSTVAVSGELINLADDARFGYFGGSRYRVAPSGERDTAEALRRVATAYLAAFGPATRADLAQWSGQPVASFAQTLGGLDLVSFKAEDGKTLLDLPDAPRPDDETTAPVRFLPKWDNLLLAYDRRDRVLPEPYRRIVIRKNGDVLPTFLVDGAVAGTWTAPLRGPAVLSLTPLQPLPGRSRAELEREGEELLAWLRPDADRRTIRWLPTSSDG